jgi:hypothetical protein
MTMNDPAKTDDFDRAASARGRSNASVSLYEQAFSDLKSTYNSMDRGGSAESRASS